MSGAITPLTQYSFMALRSVEKSTGATLPVPEIVKVKAVPVLN
jgi:hypothetical protein